MLAMEQATFLDNALELLSHAINAEDNHDYTEAYAQYMAALDYLMAAQQYEKNEKSRAFLKEKADEYLNRAEAIRQRVHIDMHKRSDMAADVDGTNKGHTTAQSVILDEAFKCAKRAIDADASHNYTEAYKQYMKSMDHFMFAQRYGHDEQSRSLIRSEVAEYLSRAEIIKEHLDSLKESRAADNANLSKGPPRPPEVVFLHTAIEITQRAIQQDVKKYYRSAYELYNDALDYFMLAHKYEKNEQKRTTIRANMEEYLTRAEVLKYIR
ncbi:hypothetical protein EV363DRAFT_1355830 [Boletus edulis]|uniref:MIT domain-containing protein n=1 Tax=Boletus edulis BED1 TaxID=1328754 RepID=A0AAD4BCF9_BOLED|nr:hypothetical protein EV363DRAFT_1355830 [Boletus edulis]KAF8420267.1 hypothetical protein L210DRAFT_3574748 [Boletus edulis BED1]